MAIENKCCELTIYIPNFFSASRLVTTGLRLTRSWRHTKSTWGSSSTTTPHPHHQFHHSWTMTLSSTPDQKITSHNHTCLQVILSDLYFLAKGKCKNEHLKNTKVSSGRDLCLYQEQESELKKCKINNNIIQWCSNAKKSLQIVLVNFKAMSTTET